MNEIHPTAIIGDDVRMGDGNYIGPFVVISGEVDHALLHPARLK